VLLTNRSKCCAWVAPTLPLSSELGTHKTVKARFWHCLEYFFEVKVLKQCSMVPSSLVSGQPGFSGGRKPVRVSQLSIQSTFSLHGDLAHNTTPPSRTLKQDHVQGPVRVLGGWAFSHERGTPVVNCRAWKGQRP